MNESITYAKRYIEDLLTFFGLNVDVHTSLEDEVIELSIPSTHLNGFLIGQRGETLRSIQMLVSSALSSQGHEITRVNVDVADYKKHRRERLAEQVELWISDVRAAKKDMELRPMSPADRRVVHKTAGDYGDIATESIGEDRDRRVVIKYVPTSEEE